ncbi:U4/U6.U5 tri-snRNP-associated protein snu66 [Trichoderma ghanense]|uniref:U4/U6.U5 tri-snRNP-associated protein snu66 n=1 Tax=Trichoderma ghanense TaxID=65468 RepID=A0ABY2HCK4_9HYPO
MITSTRHRSIMDAATIEETNRIRISLGMKPLPVPGADPSPQAATSDDEEPGSTVESRQAQAYDNYKKIQEAEAAKKRREEKAAAVRKAREKAQRSAILEGKGLGEEEQGGDLDAKSWLLGQKKRQKKIDKARKLEEELAAAEAAAAAAIQYTSKDLAGIKVAHDSTAFLDGDEQILTLKDTTIDENEEEGDELENLNIREQEKLTERLDLKKKLKGYNPNDYNDGEGTILAQYDEEINGKKAKKFTLDDDGAIAELSDILGQPERKGKKIQSISLDDIIDADAAPSSDYLAPSEIKVKKPKKKKGNKGTRQKQLDEDDIFPVEPAPVDASAMDVDTKDSSISTKRKATADDFADDDDLQASLAIQRKNALKKRKKTRPEDIAKQLKEEEEEPEEAPSGGLVIGEISEFVAGLSKPDEDDRHARRQKQATKTPEPEDRHMGGQDEDAEMDEYAAEHQEALAAAQQEEEERNRKEEEKEAAGIADEKTVGEGMGAALALLRERGLIDSSSKSGSYEDFKAREEFLAKKRILETELEEQTRQQRERDRMSGRLDRMSVREREEWARQQNTHRDHQQSKRLAELFNATYKPNVELKYVDDHGRRLDQKEAFRHMSHQFHGKGSGKGKTEKLLKKIDDEKRREAQSMFDASQTAGMTLATAQQLKKRREAGVRLG